MVASVVGGPLQFFEPLYGLATQDERITGNAHLTRALDLRATAIEGLDDLVERRHEAGSTLVGIQCSCCHGARRSAV
jgi:hypothetical protein